MSPLCRRFRLASSVLFFVAVVGLSNQRLAAQQGTIFWVDGVSKLGRVNLDGSGFQVLLTGLTNPRSVDVDEFGQKVYWVEGGPNGRIRSANFDGTNPTTIHTAANNQQFYSISVDGGGGLMYFDWEIPQQSSSIGPIGEIDRSLLNGSGRTNLYNFGTGPFSPSPGPFTIEYAPSFPGFPHLYFSPGPDPYGDIEGRDLTNNFVEPYFPTGGTKGLTFGNVAGTPTVYFDNGTSIGTFDSSIPFPPPSVSILPVPAAPDPIYGIDYNSAFLGRLVWGTVGATQSQLFTSLPNGAGYQVVHTGPEKFVDVAFVPFVPPIPEPASLTLVALAVASAGLLRWRRPKRTSSVVITVGWVESARPTIL